MKLKLETLLLFNISFAMNVFCTFKNSCLSGHFKKKNWFLKTFYAHYLLVICEEFEEKTVTNFFLNFCQILALIFFIFCFNSFAVFEFVFANSEILKSGVHWNLGLCLTSCAVNRSSPIWTVYTRFHALITFLLMIIYFLSSSSFLIFQFGLYLPTCLLAYQLLSTKLLPIFLRLLLHLPLTVPATWSHLFPIPVWSSFDDIALWFWRLLDIFNICTLSILKPPFHGFIIGIFISSDSSSCPLPPSLSVFAPFHHHNLHC